MILELTYNHSVIGLSENEGSIWIWLICQEINHSGYSKYQPSIKELWVACILISLSGAYVSILNWKAYK